MDESPPFPLYRAAVCGLLAMLLGVGIARFGYGPLVPALVARHWYSASAAFWLGTLNLAGYFVGAAVMRAWRGALSAKPFVLALMALTAVSLIASAANFGFVWFGLWRFVSGVAGGLLMVLMAAAVVGRAPAAVKGRVSGITFAGMGAGIALSAIVIPPLLSAGGLVFTWVVLGLLGVAATVAVAVMMPHSNIVMAPPAARHRISRPVLLLIIGYTGAALGFVPHMLFVSSYVAIGLGRGVAAGAAVSAWLGVAAAVGPVVLGRVADRLGFLPTMGWGYAVMAAAVALPLATHAPLALIISAIGTGAIGLGSVMLAAGSLAELVPPGRLAADWGLATMSYAVMQALVAAGFSTLFHATGNYLILFGIAGVSLVVCSGFVMAAQLVRGVA
jgi:MFS family permease